jgi:hypothetical protein
MPTRAEWQIERKRKAKPTDNVPLRPFPPPGWDEYAGPIYWNAVTVLDDDCPACVERRIHTWAEHDKTCMDARLHGIGREGY